MRNAREPYDDVIVLARQRFGSLSLDRHLIYLPTPLLGAAEDIENVQVIDAVAGMVINGDLAVQLIGDPQSDAVERLESYSDENGRSRLRVVWQTNRKE